MAAAVLIGFSSCNNEEVMPIQEDASYVSISLVGTRNVRASGGAIQPGGGDNPANREVTINAAQDAVIFVLNSANSVIHRQIITGGIAENQAGSHVLVAGGSNFLVPASASIFVVANIPGASAAAAAPSNAAWLYVAANTPNLAAITAAVSAISSQNDHNQPVLANVTATGTPVSTGTPATIGGEDYTVVEVSISPVIARMELAGITATADYHMHSISGEMRRIRGFTVTDVFLDDTAPNFTYGGLGQGILRTIGMSQTETQFQAAVLAGTLPTLIDTPHPAVQTGAALTDNWIATPATLPIANIDNQPVWAFNFAAGNVPRLVVRFDNITYSVLGDAATVHTVTGSRFITVNEFNNSRTAPRVRGNIYHIRSAAFNIDLNDLEITIINPEDTDVRVFVDVVDWNFVPTTIGW